MGGVTLPRRAHYACGASQFGHGFLLGLGMHARCNIYQGMERRRRGSFTGLRDRYASRRRKSWRGPGGHGSMLARLER